jgi:hypothetical protein
VRSANWVRTPGRQIRPVLCALAPFLLAGASIARAQPIENAVVTTLDPCVPIEQARFRRLLSVELGTSIDYQPEAPREPGRTWVHVSCSPAGIELRLEDGVTRKSMMRVLDPQPIESADRTRLLALAVAEFVVASWVELRVTPYPSVPAAGPPPPPAAQSAATRSVEQRLSASGTQLTAAPPGWEIGLGAGMQTFTSHAGVLPVFSLRLGIAALRPVTLLLGADLGLLRVPVERQEVRVGAIDTLHISGLLALAFAGEVGALSLAGGAGVRLGGVYMAGESQLPELNEKNVFAAQAGVFVLGRIGYRLSPWFDLGLELEGGVVTLPASVSVDDRVLLEFSGGWFSAGLRFTLLF